MVNDIIIKVFSDIEDITFIHSALKRVSISHVKILKQDISQLELIENELVVFQLGVPQSSILQELLKFKKRYNDRFLVVFLYFDEILKNALISLGFQDIFYLPDEVGKLDSVLNEILKSYYSYQNVLIETEEGKIDLTTILGSGDNTYQKIMLVRRAAENPDLNILITGESGTGKELLAKVIHNYYNEKAPFVDINCTAISEDMLDLELFGYEKVETSGIISKKLGLFELAEKGSILLDEISGMSLDLQSKLLRVIDKKVIKRRNSINDIPVQARIISTTNFDLSKLVEERKYRSDLFHRLNAITIDLIPLRERKEDILKLTEFFVNKFSEQYNIVINEIEKEVVEYLKDYDWPGNIRELKGIIERAVLLSENNILKRENFKIILTPEIDRGKEGKETNKNIIILELPYEEYTLLRMNKLYAEKVLKRQKGNKSRTAKILGISRPTLDNLIN